MMTMHPINLEKSDHQLHVESFMLRMKSVSQDVPLEPTIPSDDVLVLRAKLIFEEAMETIEALGVTIQLKEFKTEAYTEAGHPVALHDPKYKVPILDHNTKYHFFRDARLEPNLVEIVDGCCDIKVVTTGTLSACGVSDLVPQKIVDQNNLDKFAEGHSFRDDGKLVKPPNHKPCTDDLKSVLRAMLSDPWGTKSERLGLSGSPYAATVRRTENGSGRVSQNQDATPALTGQGPMQLD